jgi:hypothetical protein
MVHDDDDWTSSRQRLLIGPRRAVPDSDRSVVSSMGQFAVNVRNHLSRCSAILASSVTASLQLWLDFCIEQEISKDGAGNMCTVHQPLAFQCLQCNKGRKDRFPITNSPTIYPSSQLYA